MSEALTYRAAGVDIDAGNALVERIKPLVKRTSRPEVMGGLGGFGGLFDLSGKYREPVLVSGTDGVGTKLKLAQQLGRHDSKLDVDTAAAVVGGIAKGCELAGCALIGGETAEMPDMYPPGEYDLAGFTVGAVEKSALLSGAAIVAGDIVLGVASSGPHSNGYSLIRKILDRAGVTAENGGLDLDLGGIKLADALMAPTTIYVKPMLELLKQVPVHGMAHITGGGLKENIIRVVPDGLGLQLDAAAIVLPPVFEWLMREGNIAREEMWRTFNCGVGFTVLLPADAVAAASTLLTKHGLASSVIGQVVPAQGDERVHIG